LREEHNLEAFCDYPASITVTLPCAKGRLTFGTLNDEWGYDHENGDRFNEDGGLNEVLPLDATLPEVVAYMLRAVAFHTK
jgi:hypothetical protein